MRPPKSKNSDPREIVLTNHELYRLATLKHEHAVDSEGNLELNPEEIKDIFRHLTRRELSGIQDKRGGIKFAKAILRARKKDVQAVARGLEEEVSKKGYKMGSGFARAFIAHAPSYQGAREFGANSRQIMRWLNQTTRPSRGMRKHIRSQKATARRGKGSR